MGLKYIDLQQFCKHRCKIQKLLVHSTIK